MSAKSIFYVITDGDGCGSLTLSGCACHVEDERLVVMAKRRPVSERKWLYLSVVFSIIKKGGGCNGAFVRIIGMVSPADIFVKRFRMEIMMDFR